MTRIWRIVADRFLFIHTDRPYLCHPLRIEQAYELVSLYDEHTWGGFASIRRPHSPFTRANYNRKASFAYGGYGLTHELLATGGRALAKELTGVTPEGDAWRRWGQYIVSDPSADPASHRFLVINTLCWARRVRWPLPPDMGGAAPYASLEMFLVGNYREEPPLVAEIPDGMMIDVELPAFGYATVPYATIDERDALQAGDGVIENRWYRVVVDPRTGGLRSWYDKELDRELIRQDHVWAFGQYLYEWVDHPDDRRAIFALDFDREDFGVRHRDTPFRRQGPVEVELLPARIEPDGATVELRLAAPGVRSARVRFHLPSHEKSLHLDMVLDKEPNILAEAVYIPFPVAVDKPRFHLDLNGVPVEPEAEQLPGSCRDWYGIQRWAEVGNDELSVILVPMDSPLVQVGGITTGRWAHRLDTESATLVSWALHNHWDTNFKASQSEDLLLRYRLTSHSGYDPAAASRFAMEATVPPLIIRVPGAEIGAAGQFFAVEVQEQVEVHVKRAVDGRGLIAHLFNLSDAEQQVAVAPGTGVISAWRCTALEDDLEALAVVDQQAQVMVPARSVACVRLVSAD